MNRRLTRAVSLASVGALVVIAAVVLDPTPDESAPENEHTRSIDGAGSHDGSPRAGSSTTATPSDGGGWSTLSAVPIVDPRDFGARGDGQSDATGAIRSAIASLEPEGGIVFVDDGLVYKTTDVISIEGDSVKLWARSGRGQIYSETAGAKRRQAIICEDVQGCGLYGLRMRTDVDKRLDAREDSQVVFDGSSGSEAVGLEIEGSASAAIFVFGGSEQTYVEGNYLHHNWADAIHFTNGARRAWVWDNTIYNESPARGDDGVACVTYEDGRMCGEMEWWRNRHLGGDWGRGFAVIGGERIDIHDNLARGTAGAGILVASEPSYDTPGSRDISIRDNVLFETGRVIPHPGILVSARSGPIRDVVVADNLVVDNANDEEFREEGDADDVVVSNIDSAPDRLPSPMPDIADGPRPANTDVLKMRDRSFVPPLQRFGLYRIHVRKSPAGPGFEQRFEYVVAGAPQDLGRWLAGVDGVEIAHILEKGPERFVVALSPVPLTIPPQLREVGFSELRAGDNDGSLADLWTALHP